jgi:hypothetical protein
MNDEGVWMPHDEDYVPGVPNRRKRQPNRPVPRAANREEIAASMDRIVREIIERDRMRDGKLRWR